jgi:hypothetical protein
MKSLVYAAPNDVVYRDEPHPMMGAAAFRDLHKGRSVAPKIVLRP